MNHALVSEALDALLEQWKRNQQTHILEGAEDAATLLEHRFYVFIQVFKQWLSDVGVPATLEQALDMPDIQELVDKLPTPLYLPFEMELELVIDGVEQENDEKYD